MGRWAVLAAGATVTLARLWLGLWQMRAFEDTEATSAQARVALPAVDLLANVAADGSVTGDVYGRRVRVLGRYRPELSEPIPAGDRVRVLTGFLTDDGRLLPVIRGLAPDSAPVPPPATGAIELTGVFLPSEPEVNRLPATRLGSVRLAALAQLWPSGQLLPGFLTVDPGLSLATGLAPANADLPSGQGSWRNLGYALQWWVFAAAVAAVTIRFGRSRAHPGSLGVQEEA